MKWLIAIPFGIANGIVWGFLLALAKHRGTNASALIASTMADLVADA